MSAIASTARSKSSRSGPRRARASDVPPPDQTGIEELDSLALGARRRPQSGSMNCSNASARSRRRYRINCARRSPRCEWRSRPRSRLRGPTASAVLHESLGQTRPARVDDRSLLALARQTDRDSSTRLLDAVPRATVRTGRTRCRASRTPADRRAATPARARVDVDAVGHVLDVLARQRVRPRSRARSASTVRATARRWRPSMSPTRARRQRDRDPFAETGSPTRRTGSGCDWRAAWRSRRRAGSSLLPTPTTTFRLTLPVVIERATFT